MEISLITQSYTLPSTGESSALIDKDSTFDKYGLPQIKGKRLKGLLKESAREVIEMLNLDGDCYDRLFASLFGEPGKTRAKFHAKTLCVENSRKTIEQLKNFWKKYRSLLRKDEIINYYSEIRQMTAIETSGPQEGTAKSHSLRTFRLIKPGVPFKSSSPSDLLTEKEKALLFLACINMRKIGVGRNRGFGKVKCKVNFDFSIDNAVSILKAKDKIAITKNSSCEILYSHKGSENYKQMPFDIELTSPVVIAMPAGEQNTVNTYDYIPGTNIRGIVASAIIEKMNLAKSAHEDIDFYNWLLLGDTICTPAYPLKGGLKDGVEFYPAPLALQKEKGVNNLVYNLAEETLKGIKTKPIGGFIHISENKISRVKVEKSFNFHNSRQDNRAMGHSTDSGIYYYESIDEGQTYRGYLIGKEKELIKLKEMLNPSFPAGIGRSTQTQYGEVNVELGAITDIVSSVKKETNVFTITAISPILLREQETGYSQISAENLETALKLFFPKKQVEIIASYSRTVEIENYIDVWKSKTPKETAYSEGSTFKVNVTPPASVEELKKLEILGVGEKSGQGFGRVKIDWMNNKKYDIEEYVESEARRPCDDQHSMDQEFKNLVNSILEREIRERVEAMGESDAFTYSNNPSGHLIGRMELFVSTNGKSDFIKTIKELEKKPAGKDLSKCRGVHCNLYDQFIAYQNTSVTNTINDFSTEHHSITNKSGFDLEDIKDKLSGIYWIHLLRMMRKIQKKELKRQ